MKQAQAQQQHSDSSDSDSDVRKSQINYPMLHNTHLTPPPTSKVHKSFLLTFRLTLSSGITPPLNLLGQGTLVFAIFIASKIGGAFDVARVHVR